MQGGSRCKQDLHMQEEFLSIMLPSHGKHVQRPEHSSDLLHHAVTPKGMRTPGPSECLPPSFDLCSQSCHVLTVVVGVPAERIPAQVDWRGTGADGPVKVLSGISGCSSRGR